MDFVLSEIKFDIIDVFLSKSIEGYFDIYGKYVNIK